MWQGVNLVQVYSYKRWEIVFYWVSLAAVAHLHSTACTGEYRVRPPTLTCGETTIFSCVVNDILEEM